MRSIEYMIGELISTLITTGDIKNAVLIHDKENGEEILCLFQDPC